MKQAIQAVGGITGAEQATRLAVLQAMTGQGSAVGGGDVSSLSAEATGEAGAQDEVARQLQNALWSSRLRQDLLAVRDPKAQDGGKAAQGHLATDYEQAKRLQVRLDGGLEAEVRKALGMDAESGPAPDGGCGPAPDGGCGPMPNGGCGPSPSWDGQPGPNDGSVQPDSDAGPPRPDDKVVNLDASDNHDGNLQKRDSGAWGERDQQLLAQALAPQQKGFEHDLVTSWAQGPYGNCVSVAEIKAGMAAYGNRMFDEVKANTQGGYDVKMQDGHSVGVSGQEMSMAKCWSGFRGAPSEELAFAHLAFAAEAKRAQEGRHEGARTYGQAINSLNNGEYAGSVGRFLGLSQQMRRTSNPYTRDAPPSFGANYNHEMFVTRGLVDHYGSKSRSTHGMYPNSFYHFAPRPIPSQTFTVNGTTPSGGGGTPSGGGTTTTTPAST